MIDLQLGQAIYHIVKGKIVERTEIVEIEGDNARDSMCRWLVRRVRDTGQIVPVVRYVERLREYYVLENEFIARCWYGGRGREWLMDERKIDIEPMEEKIILKMLGGLDDAGYPLFAKNSVIVFVGSKISDELSRMLRRGLVDAPIWCKAIGALAYRVSDHGKTMICALMQKRREQSGKREKWQRAPGKRMVVPSVRQNKRQ